jgi:hypothetical protein
MIPMLFSPFTRWAAFFSFLVLASAAIYAKGRIDGRESAIAKIEAANDAAADIADKAERDVLNCPPGQWNREAGKCAPQ